MGATNIAVVKFGKTVGDAYREAVEEANQYYGHQDGYSGAINSSHGYILVEIPGRITIKDWISYLEQYEEDGKNTHIPKKIRVAHADLLLKQWRIWDDKHDPMLAFEMRGAELKTYKKQHLTLKGRRGSVFVFAGMVPE